MSVNCKTKSLVATTVLAASSASFQLLEFFDHFAPESFSVGVAVLLLQRRNHPSATIFRERRNRKLCLPRARLAIFLVADDFLVNLSCLIRLNSQIWRFCASLNEKSMKN